MASLSNDKQSQQQNRPVYTNWFNSLRRHKQKKPSASSASKEPEPLQRSCIDLSNSVFYLKDVDSDLAGTSSTTNIYVDEENMRKRAGTISKLCSPCCGSKQSALDLKDSQQLPTKYENLVEMPDLTIQTPPSLDNNQYEIIRNQQPLKDNVVTLVSKRADFLRTTTVTTTHTIVISRPVEVLLNKKGEIVAKSHSIGGKRYLKRRTNSLDCMLEEQGISAELGSTVMGVRPGVLVSCDDLQFIDENNSTISNNNNNNNNNFHAYNEKCQFVSQVEPTIDTTENRSKEAATNQKQKEIENLHSNDIANNERNKIVESAVIINNYKKQINDELCEVVAEMETLNVPEDCKHSNKDKQMSIGRKKFNMDPKKGIEYLVEHHLLRHDAQDVAHFLYKGEGLNKTAIGDYLGEKNDFNECVLKAFVALHDFTNLILVQALRQFLWSFRLPGEAQKIDRMMECFAQRYCQLNPDIFTNTDTCYVLSFAIIMLNTSLHNPSVKDKPTVEQFISMNRGINNGGDLPRGLLESLYESIRTEPFKIPQDDGNDLMHTFFNPDKEGWLWKQGGRYKSWKRRWFILNDNCLYYFEYTTDKEPRGIIPLENISVREIHDRSKPHCFELFATGGADFIKACKTDSEGKVVEGKHTVYRMSAATEEDQLEWISRLKQSISHNPFYDILVQRKKKALSKS